jgi:hypothetical protein
MTTEREALPAVPVPGLRLDSLGNYLASLGLVRALAHSRWPNVRAAWKDGVLHIVGGPSSVDDLLEPVWKLPPVGCGRPIGVSGRIRRSTGLRRNPHFRWRFGMLQLRSAILNSSMHISCLLRRYISTRCSAKAAVPVTAISPMGGAELRRPCVPGHLMWEKNVPISGGF